MSDTRFIITTSLEGYINALVPGGKFNNCTIGFKVPEEYLCNVFAECAFLTEAAENGSNAMACLEAYDEAYTTVESILEA